MTRYELSGLLNRLGWSVAELGRRTGYGATAKDWRIARTPVPADVADWLRAYVVAYEALNRRYPPPAKVDQRRKAA